jgi:hypothetical protein
MQKFKPNDPIESKFIGAALAIFNNAINQRASFFNGAYSTYHLGDILVNTNRAPLTRAIKQEIFREAFKEIFEAFISGGTFESYLTVFRKIFGESVSVEFIVPAPGKLIINIESDGVLLSNLMARYIENNEYFFDELVDDEGNNIVLQTVKGFETQYELEQMLFEMVPGGIYTEISLTVGV